MKEIMLRGPTMTKMWHGACHRLFFAREGEVARGSSMTMAYDNMLRADSMKFDLDVWENLHLTKSRFPVLQRTYLTLEEFESFLVRCRNVGKERGAVTKLHANPHKPRGINRTKKTGNYAHGGCIHGWDLRVDKMTKRPVLTMHSRVSYLLYMAGLDLALCYYIAKEVGQELGFAVEEFSFVWYCSSFQLAHMQSVSYVYNDPELMDAIRNTRKYPDSDYPSIKLMRGTIRSFLYKMKHGPPPEEEKYAQLGRYRKRFESRVRGDGNWKSIPLSALSLDSLKATRVHVPEGEEVELITREIA